MSSSSQYTKAMYSLFQVVPFIALAICLYYCWNKRRIYILSRQFRGSTSLPIIGNAGIFIGKDEDALEKLNKWLNRFEGPDPIKFWLGPELVIIILNPSHIEKIMRSQNFSYKMKVYNLLKFFIGEGLVTASGPRFRQHKKAIVPLLDLNFTNNCYEIFQEFTDACMDELKSHCDKGTFDLKLIIHHCFQKTISKAILGKELHTKSDHQFLEDTIRVYLLSFRRVVRPWLYPDMIYKQTAIFKEAEGIMQRVKIFLHEVTKNSFQRVESMKTLENGTKPLIDRLAERIVDNPDMMNKQEFMDHMFTLFLAGEDPLSLVSAFLCVCLGMYPEHQRKLAEELRGHFGDMPKNATLEDISHLPYLDMCIKEAIRLVPVAPLITRRVLAEYEIDGWTLPKNAGVLIPVYFIHRRKEYWENPHHFHPDHFLPEVERKRPPFAYLPFSAGTRGCVGKIFANVNLRIFMANFLQRFELEADGKLPDVKLCIDISTRPFNGYKVRVKERVWK